MRDLARDDNRYAVETGAVLTTTTGRKMSPAPKFDGSTKGKLTNSLKRLRDWLLGEAIAETELLSAGNPLANARLFLLRMQADLEGNSKGNIAPADWYTINDVLFGDMYEPQQRAPYTMDSPPAKTPAKPTKSRENLAGDGYDLLKRLATAAQNTLDSFGKTLPGWSNPGIKSKARVIEKVVTEGFTDISELKDIARGGFFVDTMANAFKVAGEIKERFTVVEDKGWKRDRLTGYYDHKIIVKIDGINAELQIVPKPIWTAKNDDGAGELYNTSRVMQEDSV